MRVLFLLKKNLSSGGYESSVPDDGKVKSSGLLNSARMTAQELEVHLGVNTSVQICTDGNEIDKFVTHFKPNICVIEAIWATPEKLKELVKLHSKVKFIVRIHSETPFLANEGTAIGWITEYIKIEGVHVGFNSETTSKEFESLYKDNDELVYLPNLYSSADIRDVTGIKSYNINGLHGEVNIASFGAIRPLKNQLIQAVASIIFADKYDLKLNFHINGSRREQGGDAVYKNIQNVFKGTKHTLVEQGWLERYEFLKLIDTLHLGLQVSFTESFNIVTADFAAMGVPIVVSDAVRWMPQAAVAKVDSAFSIVTKMEEVFSSYANQAESNLQALRSYNDSAVLAWMELL